MSSLSNSQHWRMRAEESRAMAEQCATTEAREILQRLAKDYDRLADRAEAREQAQHDRETPTG